MTQPLATDIATLLSLIGRQSPKTLSTHDTRAALRMIGDDPNPLRAAAIVARAIGAPHLFVTEKLLEACLKDRLVGLRGLASSDLEITTTEDLDEECTEAYWLDGPSLKAAREALAPLFACGLKSDARASFSRSKGLDPDGNVIERFKGATRPAFYTITFSNAASRVVLSRALGMPTRARCTAALARARSDGRLPADIEIVPTESGYGYRHVEEDRIQAVIDDIVDDVVAGVETTAA